MAALAKKIGQNVFDKTGSLVDINSKCLGKVVG